MEVKEDKGDKGEKENKEYKTPILYLRKSKAGKHLYTFNVIKRDSQGNGGEDMLLGGGVGSLIVNISDVQAVIAGKMDWAKVSVLSAEDSE